MTKRPLDKPGSYNIRILKQSDILKCPFVILMPDHYRPDGKCLCDDADHRNNVMKPEWGYTDEDFRQEGLIK